MSGSRDKQRRKKRGDGFDLGQNDRDFAQAQAKRKQTKTAVIVLFLIAIVAVVVLVLNSNLFYRNVTALRVGDTRFSITDMNFYLTQAQQQQMGGWDAVIDEDTLFDTAAEIAQRSALLHQRAVAEGLTLSPEQQEDVDETIRFWREDFADQMFESSGGFIRAHFGRGMNLRTLRDRVEFDTLGRAYADHFIQSLLDGYSEAELEAHYLEHRDNYDRVIFRLFELPLNEELEDGDFETPLPLPAPIEELEDMEETEEADEAEDAEEAEDADEDADAEEADEDEDEDTDETEDEADTATVDVPVAPGPLGTAQTVVAAGALGEESFLSALSAAMGFSEEEATIVTMRNETRSMVTFFDYGEWLLDDSRAAGDTTFIEGEEVIYILYFIGEEDNRYHTSNVRHILITPEDIDRFDEDMEPLEDMEIAALEAAAMLAAGSRADEVLAEWRAGDATEESFAELAREYSADYRGEPDPGLYEDLNHQTPFVEEFLDWSMDPARQVGDVEIVQTMFGYHIMYFSGHSEMYHRHTLAANDMSSEAFTEWLDEAIEENTWQRTFFARLVG